MPDFLSVVGVGPMFSLQALLPVAVLLFGLYFIFAKNPAPLNGKRLVRMHLYTFMFIGVVLASSGLFSLFKGSLGLVFGNSNPVPEPIPLLGEPGTRSNIQEFMPIRDNGIAFNYGMSNQSEIVYGVIVFIIGLLLALADFIALNSTEQRDKTSLLRRVTSASGVLIFSLLFLMGLTDLARDIAQSVSGEFMLSTLTVSLSMVFASLPAMFEHIGQ